MSRQITIKRTELGLSDLNLNDPANGYFVGDEWLSGGVEWQRFLAAASPWVNGDRIVAQRQVSVDETFLIYIRAATPAGLKTKMNTIATALSQYRYQVTVEWDGATYTYNGNGAGEIRFRQGRVDPVLHKAGWVGVDITVPRDPGLG